MFRLIFAVALCAMLPAGASAVGAAPASAGGYGSVDCAQNPAAQCLIDVGTTGVPGGAGSTSTSTCRDGLGRVVPCFVAGVGWYGGDGCYYQPATGADLAAAQALGGVPMPPGRWYVGRCGYPPVAAVVRYRVFGTAPGPQLLADEAVRALPLPAPVIRVNPAPPARQIVFLPTWVWLADGWWTPRSATASVPGMSVTATATPVSLVLSTGDGARVSCLGAGTAWTADRDAHAASPTCGHTYTRAGAFALTATVTWQVSWAGGGQRGGAPALTTTATLTVQVTEEQVLNGGQGG